MSRFGKKLVIVAIWAGLGILVGLHFGGGGGRAPQVLPDWTTTPATEGAGQTGIESRPKADGKAQEGQAYVYVPVTVDPVTGAYVAAVPGQPQGGSPGPATGALPQQEAQDYSVRSPEQILIPEEQKPSVDVLADKTASLLQQASQKSIRWVVSLFASAEE
ncbi:hypothetical protein GCM10010912_24610 [Paenibacillus albidus]|uniref:Uncharacterized protein n=1 Tax=Paenibacillus albidus TaxID=2041023 RepID=A0A917C9N9_9BACL|nr:hypothetical protein [Paenibacillus albidus]GGF78622.1 hypothetical protein GCM10010912_24610 [Paenibacillus albidus]